MPNSENSVQKPAKLAQLPHALHPWRCRHYPDRSEITAYVEASNQWETVAVVQPTTSASAELLATTITRLFNATRQNDDLLREAMLALEAVMDEGLNFATEQDADAVVASIKRVIS